MTVASLAGAHPTARPFIFCVGPMNLIQTPVRDPSEPLIVGAEKKGRRGRRRLSLDHLPLRPVVPASGQTLQDAVYQELRNALMTGAFSPGEALSVPALADSLHTSGMPVKDALRRLVAEGVFLVLPQSSYVVATLTASRYLDLIEARVRLETLAAEKAVPHATRLLLRTLTTINERYRTASATGRAELLRENFSFHFAIYNASQMPDVCEVILSTWLRTGPMFSLIEAELDQEEDYRKHAAIIEAIAAKDADAVSKALERDIRETARRIAPLLPS
jgi:DNA-binding GntR family transcriptional regulator